jgi:hypothetical protein
MVRVYLQDWQDIKIRRDWARFTKFCVFGNQGHERCRMRKMDDLDENGQSVLLRANEEETVVSEFLI